MKTSLSTQYNIRTKKQLSRYIATDTKTKPRLSPCDTTASLETKISS